MPLPFIIMPDSKFRSFWNVIIIFLLGYTASYVPYSTAFIDSSSSALSGFERVIDALFIMDLFINFISAYEDKDKNVEP